MAKPTAEHREHWGRVAALGCRVCQRPAEIAHCHGGSISDLGPEFRPGMAQRQNHWLVLPLCLLHHRHNSRQSLDCGNVRKWETAYGSQVDLLKEVSDLLGYSVFERAGVGSIVLSNHTN